MDYEGFTKGEKTLLVAPAGYGKTYTIVRCLAHSVGKQLILTHTHAGVASIKAKIKDAGMPTESFAVETLSSFAQRFSLAYCKSDEIPSQEDVQYHTVLVKKAASIFRSLITKRVLKASYQGLFVDEYQDCTIFQHDMVLALAESLPTHILGDPLQAIFNFNGESVDFEAHLSSFKKFPELSVPSRWYQPGGNRFVGDTLKAYRGFLDKNMPLDLVSHDENRLHVIKVDSGDFYNAESVYRKSLDKLIRNPDSNPDFNSLLVLVPEYEEINSEGNRVPKGNIHHRIRIRAQIDPSRSLHILEAIDDKGFYSVARKADRLIVSIGSSKDRWVTLVSEMLSGIFRKTDLNKWFNKTGLIRKKSLQDRLKSERMCAVGEAFFEMPKPKLLRDVLIEAKAGLRLSCKRDSLLYALLKALKHAELEQITAYDAMKNDRNSVRRLGRKTHGKCLGTTRLTKGLEFDTVAIIDAHKFTCPKHLYVALTRCCKRLIIFTESMTLFPHGDGRSM